MELITKDFGRLNGFSYENFSQTLGSPVDVTPRLIKKNKKGSKIHIKEKNKGKFTNYCGGKVTDKCIQKAKHSSNPKLRKRAIFADNVRHFKHKFGGQIVQEVKLRKMLND